MYSFLVDDSSEHEKAKGVSKKISATMSYKEYKDVLLNNKYLRYSMNGIQSKNQRIRTYETYKIILSCFDDKIHVPNIECNRLALGY